MRRLPVPLRVLLGLVSLAVIAAAGWFGTKAALGHYAPDYRVEVVLGETGQGLVPGTDVVMRGVLVGEVGRIRLGEDLRAVVELVLDPDLQIPERATFAVTGKTLLGEKQVEIRFDGDVAQGPHLPDGTVVTDPTRIVEVQDVLEDLEELIAAIDPDDLATVISDGLGAFEGQGPAIARAVDQGARAADVAARSLDDQVPALHDLSLVAESLGEIGAEFDRLARASLLGLDTLTDNRDDLVVLLDELSRFAGTLDATLTVNRPNLDRMIVRGDNVTRMLFVYAEEFGEVFSGIDHYASRFVRAWTDPGFSGTAAPFQVLVDNPLGDLCAQVAEQVAELLPVCEAVEGFPPDPGDLPLVGDLVGGAAPDDGDPDADEGDPGGLPDLPLELPTPSLPPLALDLPALDTRPDRGERQGLEAILGNVLGGGS